MEHTIIDWIKNQRIHGQSWDWLMTVGKSSDEELQIFLDHKKDYDFWMPLTPEQWKSIVEEQKRQNEISERINDENGATVIGSEEEDNSIQLPLESDSAWQVYKNRLIENGFGLQTVESIEKSAIKTLKHLSRDTRDIGPRKGLVIGNVQSGKTANMAALMAMAADNGWNMFIVLSGTIENLRKQTQKRLITDLNKWDARNNSRFNWHLIDNPSSSEEYGKRAQDYDFSLNSTQRFLSVCLKNSSRLKNLIGWLKRAGNTRGEMRLLIIDDEADQASINTSEEERTKINQLILNLINNKDKAGQAIEERFGAVNYIGYTATPYANVLNEVPGENSLYPSHFIATLAVSDEYFGPQQIFGCNETKYDGLNIIRNVPDEHISGIVDIHSGTNNELPETLVHAICWFICGVACLRFWAYNKPVSMLIHTSRITAHHKTIAEAIETWLGTISQEKLIELCKQIWDKEKNLLNVETFKEQYPDYCSLNGGGNIRELPTFDEIKSEIIILLDAGITDIKLNGEDKQPVYTNGIHLCIDNSERNNDNDSIKRLLYPDETNMPDKAPAFMVIGGQTLSRGLTIEGLISTFFLRSTISADTLMQMGRWFGYRRGYELLPRIWMSQRARDQFDFLSEMDYKLRQEIKRMDDTGVNFAEVGPRIITSPMARLIRIVASNRMRGAIEDTFDFSGHTMETGLFNNETNILNENLQLVSSFLCNLGKPSETLHYNPHNHVWFNIKLAKIIDFLQNYKYSERLRGFNDIEPLIGWLNEFTESGQIENWNVILAGPKNGNRNWSPMEGVTVNMIERTQKQERNDNKLNIGVLRSPEDFLSDITYQTKEEEANIAQIGKNTLRLKDISEIRSKFGLSNTPQLVIYIIKKDSMPRNGSKTRFPLNAVEDIAGFSINIPGEKQGRNTVRSVRIQIPEGVDRFDIQD